MVILSDKHHRARVKIACLDMYLCQKDQHIVVHALQAHTVQMQRQYYGVQQESITMKLGKHLFHHANNVHLATLLNQWDQETAMLALQAHTVQIQRRYYGVH